MHLLTAWPAIRFPIFMYQVDLILSDFFFGGWRYRWCSGHGKSSSRIRSRFWILKFRYRRKIWHFTLSVQTIDELYLKRQDGQRVVFLVSVLKSRWRSELTHTPVMHAGNEWVCHLPPCLLVLCSRSYHLPSLGPSLINDCQSITFYTFELDLLFLSWKKKLNSYSLSGLTEMMFLEKNPWIKSEKMVWQKRHKIANYHRTGTYRTREWGNPAIMQMRVQKEKSAINEVCSVHLSKFVRK